MKKFSILICALMIISLVGCNTTPNNNNNTNQGTAQTNKASTTNSGANTSTSNYKNGVYTALGDKWKYGQESATVTIKNGKMIYVTLRRLDTKGKEVNYNEWVGKKDKNGTLKPNLKKYRVDMAKRILANQSYQVDGISGATVSTGGWKLAVQRALDKAKQ